MKALIKKILQAIIPNRKIIIFESNPDFSDNTYFLFKYIVEKNLFSDYKLVWSVIDDSKKRDELCGAKITCIPEKCDTLFSKINRLLYLYSAQVIIDSNRIIQKSRKSQIRIHLGHGMPLKTVDFYMRLIGECDTYVITGDKFRDFYSQYGYEKVLYTCGYPRNEVLINSTPSDERFILWMPTYRQHNKGFSGIDNNLPMGIPAIKSEDELTVLDRHLGANNIKLCLRPHPAQDLSLFKVSQMENIVIANDEYLKSKDITLYEFIAKSSALITDYSSVYYDYLLAGRPIGLTLEDYASYSKEYGLFFKDIRNEIKGHLIDNVSDMKDFVESVANGQDEYLQDREGLRKEYGIDFFEASRLIAEDLQSKIDHK